MSEKCVKKTGDISTLQNFTPFPKSTTVLVSNELEKEITRKDKPRIVQKYLPLSHFIDSVLKRYFYLSSPSEWEDPLEVKYLDFLNSNKKKALKLKDSQKLLQMSIFCSCMTYNDSENEEASWKSYGTDKEKIIRVSYDFDKLCSILSKSVDDKVYVGKLIYKSRKEIISPTSIINNSSEVTEKDLEQLYINNFCLKQNAYAYEKELRFCKIMHDEKFKEEKSYKIYNIELSKAISHITLPPINFNKLNDIELTDKKFEQIKNYLILKSLCPDVPIYVSNLYNSKEEDMISLYNIC